MKKYLGILLSILMITMLCGFTSFNGEENKKFNLNDLYDYQKQYKTEELDVCADSTAKTYMDYRMTTVVSSRQYQFIHNYLTVDKTGFLIDDEGFIAVALGSYYGTIGDRYYFTLESGVVLPLVKAEEKADEDTDYTGCYHTIDSSIIEFVIDEDYAADYFWVNSNGYVMNGNYNNCDLLEGEIARVEKVLDEKKDNLASYNIEAKLNVNNNIYNYASGY